MPKTKAPAAPASAKPAIKGAIPEGTVIGDGKIKYVLARVDSRLLHGQVTTGWTKQLIPTVLSSFLITSPKTSCARI